MEWFINLIDQLNRFIWGPPLLIALVAVGLFYTYQLRGIQIRGFWLAHKFAFSKVDESHEGEISHFQSLMTSLAATIGIGSIAGVATAIASGGLGALFWMWMGSVIGMATKYAEAVLAVRYRKEENGRFVGGPMYYLEKGVKSPFLAKAFALATVITTLGTGNMIQSNAVAGAVREMVDIHPLVIGCILMIFSAFPLLGGIQSISKIVTVLVPVMGCIYIGGGFLILIKWFTWIPTTLLLVLKCAFTGQAAVGGFLGSTVFLAMQFGISRGVFSSETGLGSSAIATAAAKTDFGARQGLISIAGVFLTTGVVCTITAMVISLTGALGHIGSHGEVLDGAPLAFHAFEKGIRGGGLIVTLSLIPFAYSTIISWAYYGETCFSYLFGFHRVRWYRFLYTFLIIPGAVLNLHFIWSFSNLMNAFMIIPNLIGLCYLYKEVIQDTKLFYQSEVQTT